MKRTVNKVKVLNSKVIRFTSPDLLTRHIILQNPLKADTCRSIGCQMIVDFKIYTEKRGRPMGKQL